MTSTSNFDFLLLYYEYLISFIHPLPDWISNFASSLRTLVFIHSPAPRLQFDLLLRPYGHLISIIRLLPDWCLFFYFVVTHTWFHSFTRSQIKFWSSASSLRTLDCIRLPDPRFNFDLSLQLYEHLISFIHPLPDRIFIFYFAFTNTSFHSFTRSQIEFRSSTSLVQTLDCILLSARRMNLNSAPLLPST